MQDTEKIRIIAEMMDLDEEELSPDMILDDIDEYDSFFKLYLVTWVKKEQKRRLTVAEIQAFKTVQDILDYIG